MANNLKVGDFIIDFANIYQVISTERHPVTGDILIGHKPIQGTDKVFTASIPEKNISQAGLRRLMTLADVDNLYSELKLSLSPDYQFVAHQIKEDIYLNTPKILVPHLKYLWQRQGDLTKGDLDLMNTIINHLVLEISFVTQESTSSVRQKIEAVL